MSTVWATLWCKKPNTKGNQGRFIECPRLVHSISVYLSLIHMISFNPENKFRHQILRVNQTRSTKRHKIFSFTSRNFSESLYDLLLLLSLLLLSLSLSSVIKNAIYTKISQNNLETVLNASRKKSGFKTS